MTKITRKSINRIMNVRNQTPLNKLEDHIKLSLKKLFERAQREVCEYGDFAIVKEAFKNTNKDLKLGDISFEITPSVNETLKKRRVFRVRVFDEQNIDNYHAIFEGGEKNKILNYLKQDNTIKEIEDFIKLASKRLNS